MNSSGVLEELRVRVATVEFDLQFAGELRAP